MRKSAVISIVLLGLSGLNNIFSALMGYGFSHELPGMSITFVVLSCLLYLSIVILECKNDDEGCTGKLITATNSLFTLLYGILFSYSEDAAAFVFLGLGITALLVDICYHCWAQSKAERHQKNQNNAKNAYIKRLEVEANKNWWQRLWS